MSDLRYLPKDFLTEFIELYRQHPCLWQVKNKEYSDRAKKNQAYSILVEKLREIDPYASKELVIKKLNTIRGCFRKELRKVQRSLVSSSGNYKPSLWYYDLLLFVLDQDPTKNTADIEYKIEQNTEEFSDAQEETSLDFPYTAEETAEYENQSTSCMTIPPASVHHLVEAEASRGINRLYDNETAFVTSKRKEEINKERGCDEFDAIGINVACKLRRLSREKRIYAEKLLNDILFNAELGKLNETSVLVVNSQHSSSVCNSNTNTKMDEFVS